MILMSFSEIFAMPFMISQAIRSSTDKNRGSYIAAYTIAWAIALIISPLGATQVIEGFGYTALWYVMGSVCAVTAIGFGISLKKKNTNALLR